jgi:hypothetical protein
VIAHMSYVMCDRCGNAAECADDAKEARMLAGRQGFVRIGRGRTGEDVCPFCADKDDAPSSGGATSAAASAPTRPSDPAGGETARFTTEEPS